MGAGGINFGRHRIMGYPWHGLVEGGSLALPNGGVISYPQPPGGNWQAGAAALIAHPGAPAVVRTAPELVADAANGRQWLNRAVLGGESQLHGKPLGAGAWIYIDPAGDRWLVNSNLHNGRGTATTAAVTLKRFGVLGGEPLEIARLVVLPDLGQAAPDIGKPLSALEIVLYHTSPTGAGALFMIGLRVPSASAYDLRPLGWLEVIISGPGASCSITVEVRKTRAQTLGSAPRADPAPLIPPGWRLVVLDDVVVDESQGPPVCSGTITTTSTPRLVTVESGGGGAVRVEVCSGAQLIEWDSYLIALWYKPDGSLSELALSQHWTAVYDWPDVTLETVPRVRVDTLSGGGGSCNFSSTQTSEWRLTMGRTASTVTTLVMRYQLDGVLVDSSTLSFTTSTTQTQVLQGDGVNEWSEDFTETCSPGSSLVTNGGFVGVPVIAMSGPLPGFSVSSSLAERLYVGINYLARWVWPDGEGYMTAYPARYSPQLFGWLELKGQLHTGALTPRYRGAVSPSGAAPAGLIELPAISANFYTFLYGSWCPLTGQTARSQSPVCWV